MNPGQPTDRPIYTHSYQQTEPITPQQWQGAPPPPQYGPPQYAYQQAPPPKKKSRKALWITLSIIGVGIITLFVGCVAAIGGAVNSVNNDIKSANSDVTLSSCSGSGTDSPTATLTITNSSSSSRSYFVTVAFVADGGATQVDTGIASVADLAPGQTATATASAITFDPETFDTCKITNVSGL